MSSTEQESGEEAPSLALARGDAVREKSCRLGAACTSIMKEPSAT